MDPGKSPLETALADFARRRERELKTHPTAGELAAYLDGELSPPDRERLRDHLALCRPCARLVRDLAAEADLEVPDEVERRLDHDVEGGWEALKSRLGGRGGTGGNNRQERTRERLPLFQRKPFLPFALAASLVVPLSSLALAAQTILKLHARMVFLLIGLTGLAGGLAWAVPLPPPQAPCEPYAGRVVERQLGPGEKHCFAVSVPAGHVLRATAEQRAIDVVLALADQHGRKILAMDSPNGTRGPESLAVVAELTDELRVEVLGLGPARATYSLRLHPPRPAKIQDVWEARAVADLSLGAALWRRGTAGAVEALPVLARSARAARLAGAEWVEVWTQVTSGRVLVDLGRHRDSIAVFRAVRPRLRGGNEKSLVLNLMSNAHRELGHMEAARVAAMEAFEIARRDGDLVRQSGALNNIALALKAQGESQAAILALQQAVQLARQGRSPHDEGIARTNLCEAYSDLGLLDSAKEVCLKALALRRGAGDRAGEAAVLRNIGLAQVDLGRHEEAFSTLEQAVKVSRESPDLFQQASALMAFGAAALVRGDLTAARRHCASAYQIAARAGRPTLQAPTLAMLGHVDYLEGRDLLAVPRFEQAIALSRSTNQQFHLALALFGKARTLGRLGTIQEAEKAVAESLEITEEIREAAQVSAWRSSFLATRYQAYELHVDLLMQLEARQPQNGYRERALLATDRFRARALLDQISDARWREQMEELTPLRSLGGTAARPTGAPAAAARPAKPKLLRVEEIQQLLDPETSLLSFFLGEERSFVWLIEHDAVHTAVLLPRAKIEKLALRLQRLLRNPRLLSAPDEVAQLADILFDGIGDRLETRRILIVADGALRHLPFGVFPVSRAGHPATPLLEDHEITYLPSASVAGEIRRIQSGRPAAPRALAIFADPVYETDDDRLTNPLPTAASNFRRLLHTREEADQIAQLIDEKALLLTGFAATREAALSPELGRHRIVHFATHAQLEAERPEDSGIILSLVDRAGRPRNGLLRTSEIYGLRLPVDLVVLSACETALGKEIKGEGMVGLSHAFFHAGAARLLVSLWRVDDAATAALMKSFYRGLLHEGLSAPEALRKAQVELRDGSRWQSPYFWAGFVLQGDWT